MIADEIDRILIEDLPIIRGKAGIGEKKWAIAITADAVVSIALDQLRGHDFSACLEMLVGKGRCEVRGVS